LTCYPLRSVNVMMCLFTYAHLCICSDIVFRLRSLTRRQCPDIKDHKTVTCINFKLTLHFYWCTNNARTFSNISYRMLQQNTIVNGVVNFTFRANTLGHIGSE